MYVQSNLGVWYKQMTFVKKDNKPYVTLFDKLEVWVNSKPFVVNNTTVTEIIRADVKGTAGLQRSDFDVLFHQHNTHNLLEHLTIQVVTVKSHNTHAWSPGLVCNNPSVVNTPDDNILIGVCYVYSYLKSPPLFKKVDITTSDVDKFGVAPMVAGSDDVVCYALYIYCPVQYAATAHLTPTVQNPDYDMIGMMQPIEPLTHVRIPLADLPHPSVYKQQQVSLSEESPYFITLTTSLPTIKRPWFSIARAP